MDIGSYLRRLRDDAASIPIGARASAVYVDFHAVYNDSLVDNKELFAFANATLKLLNQLDVRSTLANRLVATIVDDGAGLPLAVRFDPAQFNIDKQRDIVNTVVRLSNRQDVNDPFFFCEIPTIPGLDFLHIASSDDVFNTFGDNGQGTFESGYSNIAIRRLLEDAGIAQPGQLVFDPVTVQQFMSNGFSNVSNNFDLFDFLGAADNNNLDRETLDILYNQGNDDKRVARGCLFNSNTSAVNRCIDRYALSTSPSGAAYLSWDLLPFGPIQYRDILDAGFVGPANPPGNELVRPQDGFQPFNIDGGEGIVQLKNSALAFVVYNGNFQIVSRARTYEVVSAAVGEYGNVVSVAACSSCHERFVVPFVDKMLPTAKVWGNEHVFAYEFSREQAEWDAIFESDSTRYLDSLHSVYFPQSEGELSDGIWSLGSRYLKDLSPEKIVAELGLPDVATLNEHLANLPPDLGSEDLQLVLAQQGALSRDQFTNHYQELVEEVAMGNEDFLRGCVARETLQVGEFPE